MRRRNQDQPRTLARTREPRTSRDDERRITAAASERYAGRIRAELLEALDRMQRDLDRVRELAPRVVAGAEPRSPLRMIQNGIKNIRQLFTV